MGLAGSPNSPSSQTIQTVSSMQTPIYHHVLNVASPARPAWEAEQHQALVPSTQPQAQHQPAPLPHPTPGCPLSPGTPTHSRATGRAAVRAAERAVEYTRKPLGEPPVTELRPVTPSQQMRVKSRATNLIQRYAGSNWQAATRTKWILDCVTHIDQDYREYMLDQACQIEQLQQQVQALQSSQAEMQSATQEKVQRLEAECRSQQSQLRDLQAQLLASHTDLRECQAALAQADQATAAAASQMVALHQAVSSLSEHDARTKKASSNRAFELKEALRHSQARCRQNSEQARRHAVEAWHHCHSHRVPPPHFFTLAIAELVQVAALLHLKDQERSNSLSALSIQFTNQIAAVHQVEHAAAKLEVAKVRMELEAYKEPWQAAYGHRSPTCNKALALALGLQPASRHALVPP
ncbi:hypothetical protein QJQ45_026212 [Haematococcus lacustris]|nr:hypothetical protein QJQ45_026212 [Haematococcus lacustris]